MGSYLCEPFKRGCEEGLLTFLTTFFISNSNSEKKRFPHFFGINLVCTQTIWYAYSGKNSKFLSSGILSEFQDRDDEVKVFPPFLQRICVAYDDIVTVQTDNMKRLLHL